MIVDGQATKDEVMTARQHEYILSLLDRKCVTAVFAAQLIGTLVDMPDASANGLENLKGTLERPET